jgi:hypothetical protein
MDLRDIMLVLHIAGAGTWFGANIVQAVVPTMVAKQGVAAGAGWYRVAGKLSSRLYMPVSIVILITGAVLVLETETYSFGSPFVTIGFAAVVVGALFGIFVFAPGSEEAAAAIESGDQGRIEAAVGRVTRFGAVDTLIILFTITVMVVRFGA